MTHILIISQKMQEKISEFNNELLGENKDITIVEYARELNKKYFNIDISFIDDFIDMVNKDGFNISHETLFKYEIIKKGESSNDVLRILERYNFEDGIDYARKNARVDDGRTEKIIYLFSPDVFKIICMRSKNTRKYSDYYLFLEKCVFYYNQFEKLKLETKINEISKIKLLELSKGKTLDNFVIVKCDSDTLLVTKYNNRKSTKSHDYKKYPYALIKGQNKNIHTVMKECNLKVNNIIFDLEVPSHQNFTKRIREFLKGKFERLIRYYKPVVTQGIEDRTYIEDVDDFDETEELKTSVTRFFRLNEISEEDFIDEVNNIDKMRFDI